MQRDQKRNAKPQCELRDLGEGVAKMPALIERPQAEAGVRNCGRIEHEIDNRNSPKPDVVLKPRLHRGVGDVSKRVIEEVREDVGEHDEAGGKAYLSDADAAQPSGNAGRRAGANWTNVNDCRCL